MKKKYFHKFVDEVMEDGIERSSASIIDKLKISMGGESIHGRIRSGQFVPQMSILTYYLRVNKQYIHLDANTRKSRWKRVIE